MFGSKKLIEQYEARITDLKIQIEDLKRLVYSQTSSTNIPLVSLEADAIMSQKEETISISQEEIDRLEEADKILNAEY
jgi:hypothetical protein